MASWWRHCRGGSPRRSWWTRPAGARRRPPGRPSSRWGPGSGEQWRSARSTSSSECSEQSCRTGWKYFIEIQIFSQTYLVVAPQCLVTETPPKNEMNKISMENTWLWLTIVRECDGDDSEQLYDVESGAVVHLDKCVYNNKMNWNIFGWEWSYQPVGSTNLPEGL